jgi:integrase
MPIYHKRVNGRKVWWVRVYHRGLTGSRVCETKDAAQRAHDELRQELRRRVARAEEKGRSLTPATVKHLFEAYAADMQSRGKGTESVARVEITARAVEALLPALLDKPVGAVKDSDIFAFRTARTRKGTKPSTINRDLRTLRAMLKKGRPEYRFPGGAFFQEDETRVRWLRPEEELLVLEPMPSPFREIAKLAALTLMRQGEVRLLRREDVHLEQGVVMLPKAKAGARPVILSEAARTILRGQLAEHTSEWVFPGRSGHPYSREQVGKAFRRAARGAGLHDFHFHDLRHHGATMALNKGFTAPIVMALGGWKTEKMMRRYAAVTDTTLRAAAEAVSGNEAARWNQLPVNGPGAGA